jgi:hypothetical protein
MKIYTTTNGRSQTQQPQQRSVSDSDSTTTTTPKTVDLKKKEYCKGAVGSRLEVIQDILEACSGLMSTGSCLAIRKAFLGPYNKLMSCVRMCALAGYPGAKAMHGGGGGLPAAFLLQNQCALRRQRRGAS